LCDPKLLKRKITAGISIVCALTFLLHPVNLFGGLTIKDPEYISPFQQDNPLKSAANLNFIESQINVSDYDSSQVVKGLNFVALFQGGESLFTNNHTYLALLDMDGKFINEPLVYPDQGLSLIKQVNETTFQVEIDGKMGLWNMYTNNTEILNITTSLHHDFHYNEKTQTYLALEFYIDEVMNSSGQLEPTLMDKISEYDKMGNLVWEWFLLNHTTIDATFDNEATLGVKHTWNFGTTVFPDPVHSNSLFWDIDSNSIYLNSRHLNQFYKIDYTTGEIDWIAGQNGDFTLLDKNGVEKESLWFHSHDVNPTVANKFVMFDNGVHNLTDPNTQLSRVIEISIDEERKIITEERSYQPPQEYYSSFWGGAQRLENGNLLASFGAPYHGEPSNLTTTEFGGAVLEFNSESEVVWELKLPFNWGFYRFNRFIPTLNINEIVIESTETQIIFHVNAQSYYPKSLAIFQNGNLVKTSSWDGENADIEIDLNRGSGEYEVVIRDLAGNSKRKVVVFGNLTTISEVSDSGVGSLSDQSISTSAQKRTSSTMSEPSTNRETRFILPVTSLIMLVICRRNLKSLIIANEF